MKQDKPIHALILAGSRKPNDPVALANGKSYKAFVEIAGKPMLAYVVDTLKQSGCVEHISVSLPEEAPITKEMPQLAKWFETGEISHSQAKATPVQTVLAAHASLSNEYNLLVTTADHPLLSPKMVQDFVYGSKKCGADTTAALIPLSLVLEAYPDTKRTGLRFSDNHYSSCNLFMFSSKQSYNIIDFWQRLEAHRKQPWRMAAIIGPMVVIRYLLGLLSLEASLKILGKRTNTNVHPVMMHEAEAAIDVDTIKDLELVNRISKLNNARQ